MRGTPETKRKLKRDPLLGLYRQGDFQIYELYAAEYIRKAFQLITQDIGVKVMKWDGFIDVLHATLPSRSPGHINYLCDQSSSLSELLGLRPIISPSVLIPRPRTVRFA